MNKVIKIAIEEYQCPGCISGSDIECFEINSNGGEGCGKHLAGTMATGIGEFFLGISKGFNRLGFDDKLKPFVYETFKSSEWKYCKFTVPTWKYLNENNHTFVRGHMPRLNQTFLHIFLENCIDKIDCLEITKNDIDGMD